MEDKPVEIHANPAVPTGWASVRIALLLLVGAAAGAGLIPQTWADWINTNVEPVVVAAGVLASAGLSVWRTLRTNKKAAIAAEAAPNTVAVVK